MKKIIKNEVEVFIFKKKYPTFESIFKNSLNSLDELIKCTEKHFNTKNEIAIYAADIKTNSYKQNLLPLVREIFEIVCNYSDENNEFNIPSFIDVYLGRRRDAEYSKYVSNFKN